MSSENTITYEIIDDWTTRVTTFPNGTIFRKALHPAGEPDISQYPALNKKNETEPGKCSLCGSWDISRDHPRSSEDLCEDCGLGCSICEEKSAKVSINQPGGAPDMRVCVPCAKEQVEKSPACFITEIHDPTLAERMDIIRRMKPEPETNVLTPHPPLPRLSDTCQRCGVNDNKVLPGLGYHHQECFVAKTEEEKKPEPKPKPVITYEIHGDEKIMVETYPNGMGLRKSAGIASKHEKVVILAKETYEKVLNITGDHAKACEMMANVFIAIYN
jgi:hypothetical protein